MKIEDKGIILSSYKFGEKGIITKILSENHGIIHGLTRVSKNNNLLLSGNEICFTWNARLADHLGNFKIDLEKPHPTFYFSEYRKILAISSISSLILELFPERENIKHIFVMFKSFLEGLNSENWLKTYSLMELDLLSMCGFGFDFERCSESGATEIFYISPKTGVCVSEEVGKPYHDKLFKIPTYFNNRSDFADTTEIVQGIEITRHFIARYIFNEKNKTPPFSYEEFYSELRRC